MTRGILALLLALLLIPQATAQTTERCFPETGFCISGRIREFWEQNGGLAVFGYPTAPQGEVQIEGKPFQAQNFERNRLELHPENGRPYDVLLGRLGVDRLAQQGRDWFTFPRSEARDGCRYFAETGHNVCGDILTAWRRSGLEIDGRAGKTEGENLALFGLPISDEMKETIQGQEYTVQHFERARFELHPENAPPFNVLLGLLGNEIRDNAGGAPPSAPAPAPAPAPVPTTVTLTGSGQRVTDPFSPPAAKSRVTATHSGERNFIVWAHQVNGSRRELIANTVGAPVGSRPLTIEGPLYLEVTADGDWSITIEALPTDESVAQGMSGRGDAVSGLFTPTRTGNVPYAFSHSGERNFIVWLRCDGGNDLLANIVGAGGGEAVLNIRRGPCYWDVQADGDWSFRPK